MKPSTDYDESFSAETKKGSLPVNTITSIIDELNSDHRNLLLERVSTRIEHADWIINEMGYFSISLTDDQELLINIYDWDKSASAIITGNVFFSGHVQHNVVYWKNSGSLSWKTRISEGTVERCVKFLKRDVCEKIWMLLQLTVPALLCEEEEEGDEEEEEQYSETEDSRSNACEHSGPEAQSETSKISIPKDPVCGDPSYEYLKNLENLCDAFPRPESSAVFMRSLSYLYVIQDFFQSFEAQCPRLLEHLTNENWIGPLWNLLDEAIRDSNEQLSGCLAGFFLTVVAMYAKTTNPFLSLATNPEEPNLLNPEDPLVRLLSDVNYENFFHAMEHETEFRSFSLEIEHADFLRHSCESKQIICEDDAPFAIACRFIYRIVYLRDVVFTLTDDLVYRNLTPLINAGYAYLCRLIQLTPGSIRTLKSMIPVDITAARFLLQLFSVFRIRTIQDKPLVLKTLKSEFVLESLEGYLTGKCDAARQWKGLWRENQRRLLEDEERIRRVIEKDPERKHRPSLLSNEKMTFLTLPELAVEIFHASVEQNADILRSTVLKQAAGNPNGISTLWFNLCELFSTSDNEGLHVQLCEINKKLLDPTMLERLERDDILSLFYDKGIIDKLISILLLPSPATIKDLDPVQNKAILVSVCEKVLNMISTQQFKEQAYLKYRDIQKTQDETRAFSSDFESDKPGVEHESMNPNNILPKNQDLTIDVPRPYVLEEHCMEEYERCFSKLSVTQKQQLLYDVRNELSCVKCQIADILAFCVMKHNFRIKYRNFKQNLHLTLLKMASEPYFDQFLAISAVKFLKTCLTAQADHYARIFLKHDISKFIIDFLKNKVKLPQSRGDGSLIESVILDFLSLIKIGSMSSVTVAALLKHMVETYGEDLENLNVYYFTKCQFDLFHQIKEQYTLLTESTGTFANAESGGPVLHRQQAYVINRSLLQKEDSELDRELQDSYFELDDEEEDTVMFRNSIPVEEPALPRKNNLPSFKESLTTLSLLEDDDDDDVPMFMRQSSKISENASRLEKNGVLPSISG